MWLWSGTVSSPGCVPGRDLREGPASSAEALRWLLNTNPHCQFCWGLCPSVAAGRTRLQALRQVDAGAWEEGRTLWAVPPRGRQAADALLLGGQACLGGRGSCTGPARCPQPAPLPGAASVTHGGKRAGGSLGFVFSPRLPARVSSHPPRRWCPSWSLLVLDVLIEELVRTWPGLSLVWGFAPFPGACKIGAARSNSHRRQPAPQVGSLQETTATAGRLSRPAALQEEGLLCSGG